jgi:aminoglycoside phosphotransferase family enzyme/predicted kinase
MNQGMLFDHLKNPQFYGPTVTSVKLIQTHISYVALTGSYAYKIKKPVNFGFLDFSTLDKRHYYCEEELRLNKRLCPDMYLNVLPITQKDKTLELNGEGIIVEYAIQMKEFPQDCIMTNLLQKGKISEDTIDRLCDILVKFYQSQHPSESVQRYGQLPAVKQNIDENFDQTKPMIDITIPKQLFFSIRGIVERFFQGKKEVFDQRIHQKRIYECHGDLHSGNIALVDEKIYVFDCIEFNDRFRFCDAASDVGFLAMDLDFQNYPYLSSYFITKYIEKSKDRSIYSVLNFYKSYRAFVRGKVLGFQLNDPHIDQGTKNNVLHTAKKYFELSEYYTKLFSLDLQKHPPLLFLVVGLSGTGKSTVASKIAVDYHGVLINTDVVRKESAGINRYERHHDSLNTGLYDPQKIDDTYEHVIQQAETNLQKGDNVVLDATFQKKKYRQLAYELAGRQHAMIIIIQCVCPDDVVKKRMDIRLQKKSVSDARWEIYLAQKITFEPLCSDEPNLLIDTSNDSYEDRMVFYRHLLSKALQTEEGS